MFQSFFNCALFLIVGIFFKQNFSELILKDSVHSNVIFYSFLICIFESLITIPLCIARLKNKPGLYTLIALSSLFINFFLQIYFIYFQRKEFDYIFIAKFVGPLIVVVFCIPLVISNVKFNYNKERIREIMKFSFFLTLYGIIAMLLNIVDRFILAEYLPKEQVAIYTNGYSIGSLTNALIIIPFSLAYTAIFYKKVTEPNAERYFTKIATYLFFTMIFVSLVAALIMPEAIKFFLRNPKLWDAIGIIRVILFANCINSIFYGFVFAFIYRKESKMITLYTGIALIFNVVGNFIFIKYYGIYAAGILSVLSFLLLVLLLYRKSRDYYFIKLETYKLILLSILYIGLVYLSTLIKSENLFFNFGIDVLLIILFFILLFVGRFFESIELYTIKGAINKYLKINLFRKNP